MPILSATVFYLKSPFNVNYQTASTVSISATLLLGTLFLGLSSMYIMFPCDCNIIVYLAAQGAVFFLVPFISVLSTGLYYICLMSIITYADFMIWILGSRVIFTTLPTYNFQANQMDEGYCPQLPYITAMTYLIFTWMCFGLVGGALIVGLMLWTATKYWSKRNPKPITHVDSIV